MASSTSTTVVGIRLFHRFFREVAEIETDKDDLKRYSDFIFEKMYDLLLIGQAAARANGRGMMEEWDLPITKGVQECMHRFRKMQEAIDLEPILDHMAARPQLDVEYSDDLQAHLPVVAGGLSVALAETMKVIDPKATRLHGAQWDEAFRLFNVLQ